MKKTRYIEIDDACYQVTLEATKMPIVNTFKETINGKEYTFWYRISKFGYKINPELKKYAISRAKAILQHEESIKKQVYSYIKGCTKEEYEQDYINDFEIIEPMHDEYKSDPIEVGILFTSLSQLYTAVDKNFKIYEKDTFFY